MEANYEQKANDFLSKTNTSIKIKFLKYDYHFENDNEKRDIYRVEIKRGNRAFSFNFGNSLHNTGEYIGSKNMCINEFGKYFFTKIEFEKTLRLQARYFGIQKNPNFKIPTNYDILACLQKYDVGNFDDFCSEFGYDEDSRKAEKTYNAVCKEYDNVCKIWSEEEIKILQEIN
jgi:hypothetical protein